MPVYSYQCKSCHEVIDVIQKMTDEPLSTCEKCGGLLQKKLFPPTVVYNCPGFYTTDSKKG